MRGNLARRKRNERSAKKASFSRNVPTFASGRPPLAFRRDRRVRGFRGTSNPSVSPAARAGTRGCDLVVVPDRYGGTGRRSFPRTTLRGDVVTVTPRREEDARRGRAPRRARDSARRGRAREVARGRGGRHRGASGGGARRERGASSPCPRPGSVPCRPSSSSADPSPPSPRRSNFPGGSGLTAASRTAACTRRVRARRPRPVHRLARNPAGPPAFALPVASLFSLLTPRLPSAGTLASSQASPTLGRRPCPCSSTRA